MASGRLVGDVGHGPTLHAQHEGGTARRRRHSSSPFDAFDDHLDEARKAITASIASLRAAELQLDDIQHGRRPNAEQAVRLCEQAVALHDGVRHRLVRMDLAADHSGSDEHRLPQRVKAGSPNTCRPTLSSVAACTSSFKIRRTPPAKPAADAPTVLSMAGAEDGHGAAPQRNGVMDRISAVLIDLDGTMYNPLGAIAGAAELCLHAVHAVHSAYTHMHTYTSRSAHAGATTRAPKCRRVLPWLPLTPALTLTRCRRVLRLPAAAQDPLRLPLQHGRQG